MGYCNLCGKEWNGTLATCPNHPISISVPFAQVEGPLPTLTFYTPPCEACKTKGLKIEELERRLDQSRSAMIQAMDALECDTDPVPAWEMMQACFEGVSEEDHERAKELNERASHD